MFVKNVTAQRSNLKKSRKQEMLDRLKIIHKLKHKKPTEENYDIKSPEAKKMYENVQKII